MSKYELRIAENKSPKPNLPVMEVWLEFDRLGNIDLCSRIDGGPPFYEAQINPNGKFAFIGNGNFEVIADD